MTLLEVDAVSSDMADIRIIAAETSLCGDQTQGVLGCATAWGDITIIQGWDWFVGTDPTAVGQQQFDYQTIITHELGHAVGVEHSSDSASTMYAHLSTGVARREFTANDLAELAETEHHDDHDHDDDHDSLVAALLADWSQHELPTLTEDGPLRMADSHSILPATPGGPVALGWQFSPSSISAGVLIPSVPLPTTFEDRLRQTKQQEVLADEFFGSSQFQESRGRKSDAPGAGPSNSEFHSPWNSLRPQRVASNDSGGAAENDVLVGGDGEDLVLGKSGSDVLIGGIGGGRHATDDALLEIFGEGRG